MTFILLVRTIRTLDTSVDKEFCIWESSSFQLQAAIKPYGKCPSATLECFPEASPTDPHSPLWNFQIEQCNGNNIIL